MKTKTIVTSLLALFLLAGLLSACAGTSNGATTTKTTTKTTTNTVTVTQPVDTEVYKLKFQSQSPRVTEAFKTQNDIFGKMVPMVTGGRVQIEMFGADELVPVSEITKAIAAGTVDIAFDQPLHHVGERPGELVDAMLPGALSQHRDLYVWEYIWGWNDWINQRVFHPEGVHRIGGVAEDGSALMTVDKPITRLDDLQGLQIRCVGAQADMVLAAGGSPVSVPFMEVYTALSTGVIDGLSGPTIEEDYTMGFYEQANYLMVEPMWWSIYNTRVIINLDLWNELPIDVQEVLIAATKLVDYEQSARQNALAKEYIITMQEENPNFVLTRLDPADMARFTEIQTATWDGVEARGGLDAEAVQFLREFAIMMGNIPE